MVLYCIARFVGIKWSVRGQDFVTHLAVPDHIEPEHATHTKEFPSQRKIGLYGYSSFLFHTPPYHHHHIFSPMHLSGWLVVPNYALLLTVENECVLLFHKRLNQLTPLSMWM